MSDEHVVKQIPTADEPRPDYRHLPANPPPQTWRAQQEVLPFDPGPGRFAYNDDAAMILQYGAAG